MTKNVVIVASGDTERRALPHLVSRLTNGGINLTVRIPPRHRALRLDVVEGIIKAAWYESAHNPPDKFVLLLDVDQAEPDEIMRPLRQELPKRVGALGSRVLYAYAQQHLESWFFADSANLRDYLGRSLGKVDASNPDSIHNPKQHLRNLLKGRVYTARISEAIAKGLDPRRIAERSPSFRGLVRAVNNGVGRPA